MRRKLWMIQQREWVNGRFTKWKWNPAFVAATKHDVEYEFLQIWNDYIGNTTMETIKDSRRAAWLMVELPEIK